MLATRMAPACGTPGTLTSPPGKRFAGPHICSTSMISSRPWTGGGRYSRAPCSSRTRRHARRIAWSWACPPMASHTPPSYRRAGRSAWTSQPWRGPAWVSHGTTPSQGPTAIRALPPVGPCASLSRLLGPANQRWYSWRSDRYHWRGPPSQSGMYSCSQSGEPSPHLLERHVQTFIIQTAAQRLKLLAELPRVPSYNMRCESLLVLPYFYDRAMILPAALLQHFKAHVAVIVATGLGQLLQQNEG